MSAQIDAARERAASLRVPVPRWLARRLGLRSLLWLAFGSAIFATLLSIAVFVWSQQALDKGAAHFESVTVPVVLRAATASDALLRARRFEKDFLLAPRGIGVTEGEARYVTLWKGALQELRTDLRDIAEADHDPDSKLGQHVRKLLAALPNYEQGFLDVVALQMRVGSPDAGLESEMTDKAAKTAAALERLSLPAAAAAFDSMRGAEKDFLLAPVFRASAGHAQQADRLRRLLENSRASEQRAEALAALNDYVDVFSRYAAAVFQLDDKKRAYLDAVAEMEPEVVLLEADAVYASNQEIRALESASRHRLLYAVLVAALAILVIFLMAVLVSRHVALGTSQVLGFAQRVAAGRAGARLKLLGGAEIDQMNHALNAMAVQLEQTRESIDQRNAALAALNAELEKRVAERTAEIENTYAVLEAQNSDTLVLAEMSAMLQTCRSSQEAFDIAGRFCARLLPQAAGGVYILRASQNQLERACAWGSLEMVSHFEQTDCWALRRGQPYSAKGGQAALRCAHATPEASASLHCVPMTAQGNVIGLLHLAFDAGLTAERVERKERLAASLAGQTALALANLQLRETLREQSLRDPLTGLYNRRYLEESLTQEVARARRGAHPLAVFMLDVDHFKKFNDAHGHEAGDAVLKALARQLRSSCRDGDVICRFGGEEFSAFLPQTPQAGACVWAERLMARVRAMRVTAPVPLPGVTISMGLAMYPDHGESPEALLQAADLALYDAKHAGRDRLQISEVGAPGGG